MLLMAASVSNEAKRVAVNKTERASENKGKGESADGKNIKRHADRLREIKMYVKDK